MPSHSVAFCRTRPDFDLTCVLAKGLFTPLLWSGGAKSKFAGCIMAKPYEYHLEILRTHCRVCSLKFTGTQYSCSQFSTELNECFGLSVENDEYGVHPTRFCKNCKRRLDRALSAAARSKKVAVSNIIVDWCRHSRTNNCLVCEHYGKRGRKNSLARYDKSTVDVDTTNSGKIEQLINQSTADLSRIFNIIDDKAGPRYRTDVPLHPDRILNPLSQDYICQICKEVLNCPVQLLCEGNHLFCSDCLREWLGTSPTCPLCRVRVTEMSITRIPVALCNIMGELQIHCDYDWKGCREACTLSNLSEHVIFCTYKESPLPIHVEHSYALPPEKEPCKTNVSSSQDISSIEAVEVLLERNGIEKIPRFEELATKVVKRKLQLAESDQDVPVVRFKTKGMPFHMKPVTAPRKAAEEVSSKTLRHRAKIVNETRQQISGKNTSVASQICAELKALPGEERQSALASYTPDIPDDGGLTLKSDIGLSWNSLRKLRRWFKEWKIKLNSEGRDREKAKLRQYQLISKSLPFHFIVKGPDGKQSTEIRLEPCVAIRDVTAAVIDRLDHLERLNKLVEFPSLPPDQIILKFGGDKGSGTMKSVFQICNVDHPNSVENTVIWNIFCAADTPSNTRLAYGINGDQINEIDGYVWKGKQIVTHLSGDYLYLAMMYGLSGASGKYFCLWCLVTSTEAALPPEQQDIQPRTLEQIKEDHRK
ncbi:uncharacterized protein [Ptychodera flava]